MILSDYIYLLILLITSVFGLANFKSCSPPFKVLTVFLLVTFCKEMPTTILANLGKNHNLFQNLYTPIHVAFFVIIYYLLLVHSRFKKIILYTGAFVFSFVTMGILTSEMNRLPWVFISIDALMLVFFSILYFFDLMQNPVEQNIVVCGSMWLNTSVIIYFTASFIFWISFNFISTQPNSIKDLLFYILDQLGSVHYFLLFIALYFHIREKRRNVFIAG